MSKIKLRTSLLVRTLPDIPWGQIPVWQGVGKKAVIVGFIQHLDQKTYQRLKYYRYCLQKKSIYRRRNSKVWHSLTKDVFPDLPKYAFVKHLDGNLYNWSRNNLKIIVPVSSGLQAKVIDLYTNEKLDMHQTAAACGIAPSTVFKMLQKGGIETR